MPTNGHTSSSQTLFFPRLNGPPGARRISVTASPEPSAVRPEGLPAAHDLAQSTPSVSGASSVDGERPAVRGWQDKAGLPAGSPASSQPAPGTERARAGQSDTAGDRTENPLDPRERKEHSSIWLRTRVKSAMRQLATDAEMSFSSACDKGLEIYARAAIRDQEETLFEPRMQAMMRREIRASDKRHLYFEMCNAIASEQTRIYTADLYKRQLHKEGMPLKEIHKKLDDAYTMARDNILRKAKTPQLKNLFDAWWRLTEEHTDGDHQEHTGTGAAGKEPPNV